MNMAAPAKRQVRIKAGVRMISSSRMGADAPSCATP
jgi:hypothetical protein